MDFTFDEPQEQLRGEARRFLQERCPLETTARLVESEPGWDPGGWAAIAAVGWLGAGAPEEVGGAGLGFVEEAILIEEFGRALYPGPFFATVALASSGLRGEELRELVAGRQRWSAQPRPGALVPNLTQVDRVLVWREGALMACPATGVAAPTVDPTRGLGRLESGEGEVVLRGAEAAEARSRLRLRARAGSALEAVGIAQAVLELGVEHARTREQFGRPIGVYQAVSHKLADTYQELELARSLAYWAAWCIAEGESDAELAAASARSLATETAVAACERVVQVFGGMGFTWEAPLHRYYKRALWLERFGWSPAECRAEVARELLARAGEGGG